MGKHISWFCLITLIFAFCFGGCQLVRVEEEPRKPLEYTIVKQEEIPKEVQQLISEKKKKEFQMTYQNKKDLYLIKGYGQQMSGGYSIQVEELGVSSNGIFFKTKLLGPSESSQDGEPSYPYIAVKINYRKEPVQFE